MEIHFTVTIEHLCCGTEDSRQAYLTMIYLFRKGCHVGVDTMFSDRTSEKDSVILQTTGRTRSVTLKTHVGNRSNQEDTVGANLVIRRTAATVVIPWRDQACFSNALRSTSPLLEVCGDSEIGRQSSRCVNPSLDVCTVVKCGLPDVVGDW